jgi:hypothetical protein
VSRQLLDRRCFRACAADPHGKHPQRAGDIFEALCAEIIESDIDLAHSIRMHPAGNADAAGLGQPFEPCGEVDPSPKMSPSSTMMSPWWMPKRNSIRFSAGTSALRSPIARCTSTAQRTASTTLANSANKQTPSRFQTFARLPYAGKASRLDLAAEIGERDPSTSCRGSSRAALMRS